MQVDLPITDITVVKSFVENITIFFEHSIWNILGNLFTFIGVLSSVLAVIQFVHNSKLKTWKNNFCIKDFPADYDVEQNVLNAIYTKLWCEPDEYLTTIIFTPVDCVISKVELIELDLEGKTKKVIETFENLTPEDSLCFRLERYECIPKYKIKWYSDYGEYCEHYFHENGRNGITEVNGAVYHATPMSVIKKILGLQ